MIIVTTPMCKQIVEWAGLKNFKVNKHPDDEEGDFAILLSESKVNMDSLTLKLNTFSQIKESILKVSMFCFKNGLIDSPISDEDIISIFKKHKNLEFANLDVFSFDKIRKNNYGKNVKVYSNFLKDIVEDIGVNVFDISDSKHYDYVVFPDYLKDFVLKNEDYKDYKDSVNFIQIPTHSNVSKNPLERAEERYSILINELR